MAKNLCANARDTRDVGLIPGLGRYPGVGNSNLFQSPGGGHGKPLWYSCLENSHWQRSLVGYSPWGLKELDMTDQLSTAQPVFLPGKPPLTEEPVRLPSMGSQRVRHNWLAKFAHTPFYMQVLCWAQWQEFTSISGYCYSTFQVRKLRSGRWRKWPKDTG